MKICSICKQRKLIDQFSKNEHRCRKCNNFRRRKQTKIYKAYWQIHNAYHEHPTGQKKCSRCERIKEIAIGFSKDVTSVDGLQCRCKKCAVQIYQIKKYGFALPDDAICEICGRADTTGIDHCHATNGFRGFLCRNCNLGLGAFRDNPDLILKAIEYIYNE